MMPPFQKKRLPDKRPELLALHQREGVGYGVKFQTAQVSSEKVERREQKMATMLLWWGLAGVVGWFLLPASLESLSVAVGDLAAELGAQPLPSRDVLKLVGGVILLAAMWRWTTQKSVRSRSGHRMR
jgi:hypothetical protein